MADKNAEVAVEGNGGMKKTLSLWNFFTIGFGAIIGTGWVLQVGDWMVVGGGPVPAMIAFLLGAIFLVPVGAVFGELTAAIPISGGIVEYVDQFVEKPVHTGIVREAAHGGGAACATVTFLPRGKAGASAGRTTKTLALVTKLTGARRPLLR